MSRRHSFLLFFIFVSFINTSIFALCSSAFKEGFGAGTIVHTDAGPRKIEDIQVGNLVFAKDLENDLQIICPVADIYKEFIPSYIEIAFEHETILVAQGQKFYCDFFDKWITAQELYQSKELQKQFAEIEEIRQINERVEIYKLVIVHQHNFYVTEKQLLVHNFVPLLVAVPPAANFVITIAGPIVGPIVLTAAKAVAPAVGGWIASRIIKGFMGNRTQNKKWFQEYEDQEKGRNNVARNEPQNQDKKPNQKSKSQNDDGSGGPGGPNWPPKKNSNDKKDPDKNNDDKNDQKKEDKDSKEKKDNEQKKNKNEEKESESEKQPRIEPQTPTEIAKYIADNADKIAKKLDEPLKWLIKNGNTFKTIRYDAFKIRHIFSENHITNGILKLAENIKCLFEKTEFISQKILQIVSEADKACGFKEGLNPIQTYINELPVEIHVFLEGNTIMSFDAFIGHSIRSSTSNNLIKI